MPRGPRGEKRPADVIGTAVMVAKIATGEIKDTKTEKNPHAAALGRMGGARGGKARADDALREHGRGRRAGRGRPWSVGHLFGMDPFHLGVGCGLAFAEFLGVSHHRLGISLRLAVSDLDGIFVRSGVGERGDRPEPQQRCRQDESQPEPGGCHRHAPFRSCRTTRAPDRC